MKETLAKLISNVLNPFLMSVVILALLALEAEPDIIDAIEWVIIAIALSILPVFIVIIGLVRSKKLDSFFDNPRQQRSSIYIIASALGALDCFIFWYIKAPELLAVTFTAGFLAVVVFMAVNHFWKISLHTAFIAASVVVVIITYGAIAAWTVILLPLVGWARISLKQHTPAQVVIGGLLAAVIVTVVFWGFGVIG